MIQTNFDKNGNKKASKSKTMASDYDCISKRDSEEHKHFRIWIQDIREFGIVRSCQQARAFIKGSRMGHLARA